MSRFLRAATLITAARAVAFDGVPAQATETVVPDATFYRPEITEGPSIQELLKRDEDTTVLFAPDNTCGYVSGLAGAAYTCNSGYTCGFVIGQGYGAVGCCTGTVCGVRATCLDYQAIYSQSACDNGCLQDTYTAKCTSSPYTYCGTVTFFSGVRDYYCDSLSISTKQQLYTTYNGENDDRVWQQVILPPSGSDSTSATGPADEISFTFGSTTRSGVSSSTTSSSTTNGGGGGNSNNGNQDPGNGNGNGNSSGGTKKSSTPIGPIVGGVVGGVGAIALVVLAIFFIIRHNNKKKNTAAAAVATPTLNPGQPMQQTATAPGGPGYPPQQPPQQGYNNGPYQQAPYPPQQGSPPPQSYYNPSEQKPAGFVSLAPTSVPDRHDSTSPVSHYSDNRYSTQQQQQQPTPLSPTSTLNSSWGPQQHQYQHQPTPPSVPSVPSVPATVHEAGGNVVGERDYNANHRGQFHELGS